MRINIFYGHGHTGQTVPLTLFSGTETCIPLDLDTCAHPPKPQGSICMAALQKLLSHILNTWRGYILRISIKCHLVLKNVK